MYTKNCKKCKKDLPLADFYKAGKYLQSKCKKCMKENSIIYVFKNKERVKENYKKWRKDNPEKVKSSWIKSNLRLESLYSRYKYEAKRKNLEFKISLNDFKKILNNNCHYCGTSKKIGIDRKYNNNGYTSKNCVTCCWECNRFKNNKDYKLFTKRCIAIGFHLLKKHV